MYQYKREPLNNDEVNKLTNACNTFREKFIVCTLLDTGLRLSELAEFRGIGVRLRGIGVRLHNFTFYFRFTFCEFVNPKRQKNFLKENLAKWEIKL